MLRSLVSGSFAVLAIFSLAPAREANADTAAHAASFRGSLEDAETADDIYDFFEETSPRFWKELGKTARQEAVDTFLKLRRDEEDRVNLKTLAAKALRYARVNDAIYYRDDLVEILEPELGRELGWGERDGAYYVRKAADEIAREGSGPGGVYRTYYEFKHAYRRAVNAYMTGR